MKHSPSTGHLRQFVYIDSSEEESQSARETEQKPDKARKQCPIHNQLPQTNDFNQKISSIVQQQIQKIEHGDLLLVPPQEKEIQEAAKKKQQKYQWFLRQMQIDKKYKAVVGSKVAKIKEQNSRKEQVLKRKRMKDHFQEEQDQLRRHVILKESSQQRAVNHLQQFAHRLGIERNIHTAKRVKSQVNEKRAKVEDQLCSLQGRQRNELEQLKSRYKEMKEEERLNKLEQGKVLRELLLKNNQLKNQLQTQLTMKNDFIV